MSANIARRMRCSCANPSARPTAATSRSWRASSRNRVAPSSGSISGRRRTPIVQASPSTSSRASTCRRWISPKSLPISPAPCRCRARSRPRPRSSKRFKPITRPMGREPDHEPEAHSRYRNPAMIGRWMGGMAALALIGAPALAAAPTPLPDSLSVEDALAGKTGVDADLAETPVATVGPQDGPMMPGQDPFYCGERKLGTWFYCEKPKAPDRNNPAVSPPTPSYRQQLDRIGARLEELKARAILEPSPENIVAYVRYQREQLDRASTFADVWERAIWQHPDLDYTLQRPVG